MKQFTTMTLRALDSEENEDLVRIMNNVMDKEGLKTGQSVIEFIIRDYIRKKNELYNVREDFTKYRQNAEKEIKTLKEDNKGMKDTMKLFNEFSKMVKSMINNIELNIDLYEYQVLRIVCYRQFQLISAHFRVQKSASIDPSLIVATLYSTMFSVSPELIKLKKNGYKKIKLHYYEAQHYSIFWVWMVATHHSISGTN
jgi:hypothetical protein